MSFFRFGLILTTGWLSLSFAFADGLDGPELPCQNCPEFSELMQYPAPGIWFNPDQSGSGFTLEVQDGIVAGYYYLYDEDGRPEWLMFTDDLQVNEDEDNDARWVLETDLLRFTGGACLNCPYQPFEDVESVGTLTMEVPWRNHARFSVDGGAVQRIIPMAYATPMTPPLFQPFSEFRFPSPAIDKQKKPPSSLAPKESWAFVFRRQLGLGWIYAMLPVSFGGAWEPDGDAGYSVNLGANLAGSGQYLWGTLLCWVETDSGPLCRIDFDLEETDGNIEDHFVNQPFFLAPGNIGHDRIKA